MRSSSKPSLDHDTGAAPAPTEGGSRRYPFTLEEIRSRTYKPRDAWWTVILVDPLAARLVRVAARYRWITPNRLTLGAFAVGLGSAALMGGQYLATDQVRYLIAGGGVLVLDMFRYLNAWQIGKVKAEMRMKIAELRGEPANFVEEMVQEIPAGEADLPDMDPTAVDLSGEFRSKFSTFIRLRNYLIRHRIRIHLVSGIEFQMAAFVVGPITGAVIALPVVAGVLMVAFELLLVYKLYLSARGFEREIARLGATQLGTAQAETAQTETLSAPAGTVPLIPNQRTASTAPDSLRVG